MYVFVQFNEQEQMSIPTLTVEQRSLQRFQKNDNEPTDKDVRVKRQNNAEIIRKSEREKKLGQRRNQFVRPDGSGYTEEEVTMLHSSLQKSNDQFRVNQVICQKHLRAFASFQKIPQLSSVAVRYGLIQLASDALKQDNSILQFEALWCLTNIASEEHFEIDIAYSGIIPEFCRLLNSPNANVIEQCLWLISNLTCEQEEIRITLLDQGGQNLIMKIYEILSNPKMPNKILKEGASAVGFMFTGIQQPFIGRLIPVLFNIVQNSSDLEVITECVNSLRKFYKSPLAVTKPYTNSDNIKLLLSLVKESINKSTTRSIFNILVDISEDDEFIKIIIDNGGLQIMHAYLQISQNQSIINDIMFIMSNIAACDDATIVQRMISEGLISTFLNIIAEPHTAEQQQYQQSQDQHQNEDEMNQSDDDEDDEQYPTYEHRLSSKVFINAIWIIGNLLQNDSFEILMILCGSGLAKALSIIVDMNMNNIKVLEKALMSINKMLKQAEYFDSRDEQTQLRLMDLLYAQSQLQIQAGIDLNEQQQKEQEINKQERLADEQLIFGEKLSESRSSGSSLMISLTNKHHQSIQQQKHHSHSGNDELNNSYESLFHQLIIPAPQYIQFFEDIISVNRQQGHSVTHSNQQLDPVSPLPESMMKERGILEAKLIQSMIEEGINYHMRELLGHKNKKIDKAAKFLYEKYFSQDGDEDVAFLEFDSAAL
ncbi:MAG: hypothetical protein EZS28_004257 [Streblomastix strix]|uniref:Uncharacterized protein n=1 Tax=Streblomastix strix TaxID=222440 RepID=A0A5J4WZD9_9EUKA|nr:MAG: hypothetical protein EZS28_004257 [Streblomastix strix]